MLLSIKTYQYYVISPDTINVGSVSMLQPVNGIIDVHAHIIPKADDGSRYLGETRFMLKEAYAQGIRSVIATPHYLHRHNKMSAGQILDALEKVKKMAGEIAPDLTIYSGEELFYHDGIVEALQSGRALSLGGGLITRLVNAIENHMVTNMAKDQYLDMGMAVLNSQQELGDKDFLTIPGQAVETINFDEYYPDLDELKRIIIELFYKEI